MQSNYKRLEQYIEPVVGRNNDLGNLPLVGLSIQKKFIPSIANTIGTDMSTYRVIEKEQFAYGPVTSRNGDKITIALFEDYERALISQAYIPFAVKDKQALDPEYLMMWFRRPEFDRYARFKSHGSAREIFDWEEMCNVQLPVPPIERQREIVAEYNAICNRIRLNEQMIRKLEETAQAVYREWFVVNKEECWGSKKIEEVGNIITGKTPPTEDEENFGDFMPFITIPDMHNSTFVIKTDRRLSKKGVASQRNKTLPPDTICVSCIGTAGLVSIVDEPSQTNQQINSIVCHKYFSIYYLFLTMRYISDIIQSHGEKGSVGNNLNKQEFANLEIVFPDDDLLSAFQNTLFPIFELVKIKLKENQKLTELKGLLLSRLATVN